MLETYPRDELFQIDDDMLYQFALAILQLDERPRARVLPRRDRFESLIPRYALKAPFAFGADAALRVKQSVRMIFAFEILRHFAA